MGPDTMTTVLLWTLVVLGAWNGLNSIARVINKAPATPYGWSILTGAWAAAILLLR